MQAYKFNTFILENGIIFFPFFEPSFNKQEVEVIVLPVSKENNNNSQVETELFSKTFLQATEKAEKYTANDFLNEWAGAFKLENNNIDNAKYEYLTEKYK
ncbi:MAG: hypothetical protein LBN95_08285 [Prevotellaceae bacterium]|jgi:hypothetical protein|nr:hypothetical protein [Prevotellaceae bacterium]